jgi:hypothetical protein
MELIAVAVVSANLHSLDRGSEWLAWPLLHNHTRRARIAMDMPDYITAALSNIES